MRLVLISDTHNFHDQVKVPDGDVLVHSGDMSLSGTEQEIQDFGDWFYEQPHQHKVIIAGNHDWLFQRDRQLAEALLCHNSCAVIYLENSGIEIDDKKFYGSPVQPWFFDWAFNVPRGSAIKRYWDMIPSDTDVLITHGPPHGILDQSVPRRQTDHLGCEELSLAVERVNPKVHVFGHIHGGYGKQEAGDTIFVNASVVDESYKVRNEPIVVDL